MGGNNVIRETKDILNVIICKILINKHGKTSVGVYWSGQCSWLKVVRMIE
jgi:hypothetical protein